MKIKIILVLLFATIGLLSAHIDLHRPQSTAAKTHGGDDEEKAEKGCCDNCGSCSLGNVRNARCQCKDIVYKCRPGCKKCVKFPIEISPPRYTCNDMSFFDCQRRCSII